MTPDQAALERAWGLSAPEGYRQSYNLAPSLLAPVLTPAAGGGLAFSLSLKVFGFQPVWAKRSWINARAETVFTSRAFAEAARRQRCLVPAVGWYEWQGEKPPRRPWLIHLDGFKPFAFAGIFTPASASHSGGFAILTTAAPGALAAIHARMPVVLDPAAHARWLARDTATSEAEAMLGRALAKFAAYEVSSYVNKPEHDGAACIKPL